MTKFDQTAKSSPEETGKSVIYLGLSDKAVIAFFSMVASFLTGFTCGKIEIPKEVQLINRAAISNINEADMHTTNTEPVINSLFT